ncbi:hypothetical protein GmHk_06G016254 [Glycine max]|nr:hypothetical protein GYH30_015385 [Glycine max]KAH1246091.1 hypothetical protein GmHk_06G016254 [Glycine max]
MKRVFRQLSSFTCLLNSHSPCAQSSPHLPREGEVLPRRDFPLHPKGVSRRPLPHHPHHPHQLLLPRRQGRSCLLHLREASQAQPPLHVVTLNTLIYDFYLNGVVSTVLKFDDEMVVDSFESNETTWQRKWFGRVFCWCLCVYSFD